LGVEKEAGFNVPFTGVCTGLSDAPAVPAAPFSASFRKRGVIGDTGVEGVEGVEGDEGDEGVRGEEGEEGEEGKERGWGDEGRGREFIPTPPPLSPPFVFLSAVPTESPSPTDPPTKSPTKSPALFQSNFRVSGRSRRLTDVRDVREVREPPAEGAVWRETLRVCGIVLCGIVL
jgi:hypothetical protein